MSDTKEVLKKVGEDLKVEPVTKEFTLNSFDLTERLNDEKIEAALGENHLFDRGEVYALIGNLIAKQPKGEEGVLLNDGKANLFYTEAFVVGVGWDSHDSRWYVDSWHRDERGWDAGYRVFSPAN